ncbi:DNA-binding transcriptional regulator, FadR family [Draconibacterium orientale]|uniref:DNA-binding transcriptional regulator, FadR family n=1 Tax=Draconibacterium orientale TaxID=1168034 RepID=X5DC31_9BACT|nr:GntR family transcriptional regulator [Draconibacterium orientale]AHW60358.1 GntR family transcriptional regulator [Draconibacterium orientale]SET82099.1 DNA-binding transcriptional regulator, FadR family [Draconibacterium orientale]
MAENNLINQIKTVDNSSLVDRVEMQLMEIFVNRGLKTGDMIPKEMELANAMGVSRTVIRESLTRLKTMGLVDSIKHKGTVLTSPNLAQVLQKSMIPKILDDETLKNIFEIRLILEIGMADSIFRNITDKDIRELENITNSEPESTREVLFDIDHEVKFHGKLYQITNNYTLMNFQTILLPAFNYVYDSGLINRPLKKKKHVSHKQLVEVLKTGSPKKFREGMRKHLDNHFDRLFE